MGHYINNSWSVFALLDSKDQVRLLFKDLLTPTESKMVAKRLEIALRLMGNQSYEEIREEVGVTDGTIAAISNTLVEKGDGFRVAFKKLKKLQENIQKQQDERIKNLENPFRRKVFRRTVLGTVIKVGLHKIDRTLSKRSKNQSAKKNLPV